MTKKQKKIQDSKMRVEISWNIGTRYMKSAKDYDRKNNKRELRRMVAEY